MSLKNQQDLLARLFTDSSLCRQFLADPYTVSLSFELSSTEIDDLVAIVPAEIEHFAHSLISKRLNEAEKLLPLLKRVQGEKFRPDFRRFADQFNSLSPKKHQEDASAFCAHVLACDRAEIEKDAARFEQARLDFFSREMRFKFRFFRCDLLSLLRDEGETPVSPIERKFSCAVWWRFGKKTYFRVW